MASALLVTACENAPEPDPPEPPLPVTVPTGFMAEVFESYLALPTSLAFPPDGTERLFVNELQTGRTIILEDGERLDAPFIELATNVTGGFPVDGENGLLGITFDPNYPQNGYVYFTYAYRTGGEAYGRVVRFRDVDNRGVEGTILLDRIPAEAGHQIQSLTFGPDGKLYVSIGDAYLEERAQEPADVLGKILRMNPDGSVPPDNPFGDSYAYAIGFRNCFDLVFRSNGDLLTTCNGPEWKDEFSVVERGGNHGWPLWIGQSRPEGFVAPIHVWEEIVSPTGMLIYRGSQFPERYRGKLFQVLFGPTKSPGPSTIAKRIQVVDLEGEGSSTITHLEEFLVYGWQGIGNPVDIAEGPDGTLYFTDIFQGKVFRIRYVD